jgi:hypothetical protein
MTTLSGTVILFWRGFVHSPKTVWSPYVQSWRIGWNTVGISLSVPVGPIYVYVDTRFHWLRRAAKFVPLPEARTLLTPAGTEVPYTVW